MMKNNLEKPKAGLYIHIPFCKKKCNYCSFYSLTAINKAPEFIAALQKEMEIYQDWWPEYDTVYLGGGTPSLLSINHLAELAHKIRKIFSLSSDAEWTIEVNPDDITLTFLKNIKSCGFNRLSIGIQSIQDNTLSWLGRRHNAQQALQAFDLAKKAGFQNIGVDLIYGVPISKLTLWEKELQQIIALKPEHISAYQLSFEPGSIFFKKKNQGHIQPLREKEEFSFFVNTSQILQTAGYIHYEVSNFSRDQTKKSAHNQKYWQHLPYLGLGPAAHSFRPFRRHWNHRSLDQYCQDLSKNIAPIKGFEELKINELRLETLYFGFRTSRGIDLKKIQEKFNQNLISDPPGLAHRLIQEKKLILFNGYLAPTTLGLALADALPLLW